MSERIPLEVVAPGKRLLLDYAARSPALARIHARHYANPADLRAVAGEIDGREYPRSTLAEILEEQNRGFAGDGEALRGARRLSDVRALAVVGGQQAGLFGGPLYTIHKALTIAKLAAELERDLERPVVPVFWIASDDHDLAEVDHCDLPDSSRTLRVRLESPSTASRLPVCEVALGDGILAAIDRTREILGQAPFAREALDALRDAYRPGASYSGAFGRWMQHVLRGQGVVLVDPSDIRIKRLLTPLFRAEIRDGSPVSRAVLRRTSLLEGAGYRAQVEVHEGILALFLHDPGRESIATSGDGFLLKATGRKIPKAELLDLAEEAPERFSPNALLRPVCQDSLFPTVATVLGPSEIAYHFQIAEAYAAFAVPQPILIPRASLTLVEPRTASLLRRTGASLADVLSWGGRTEVELARRRIPADLAEALERGRGEEVGRWASLRREAGELDPTLRRTAELASGRIDRQYRFLAGKVAKAVLRRDGELRSQAARLTASLCPRSSLQERVHPLLPYLAACGPEVMRRIREAIDTADPSHVGVEV